ncbi:MAG: DUF4249 domain-containing protein [Calditrichia bacterium]|nr:DUF4249 domain-containing protein [Calditrichia bacterium]
MRSLKNIITLFCIAWMLPSCIEEFVPDIEAGDSSKYVVFGELTTEQEDQIISVSLVSSIRDPQRIPLNDCFVRIVDSNGKSFSGTEFEDGKYKVRIPLENLSIGDEYRLEIETAAGAKLVSDFEELLACPDIDSVYYIRENIPTNDPEVFIEGIQLYLNLDAQGSGNVYYKFDVEETWEYHTALPLEWYFDGTLHQVIPMDWSHNICWRTELIKDIFILNTAELQDNAYKQYPLHFVDNTTQRLLYMYSILVRQYAISEQAYIFWDQLRMNNLEQGGLYDTQPLTVQSNLENQTNPDQAVLGYFKVSSVKTKRIFIKDVDNLEIGYQPTCSPSVLRFGLRELTPDRYDYPVYLLVDRGAISELTPECIFCELAGGTTTRPDYWPDTK